MTGDWQLVRKILTAERAEIAEAYYFLFFYPANPVILSNS